MSKFTLGQRQFPTLGLRSQQPKNYVGPTLSCYLGLYSSIIRSFLDGYCHDQDSPHDSWNCASTRKFVVLLFD